MNETTKPEAAQGQQVAHERMVMPHGQYYALPLGFWQMIDGELADTLRALKNIELAFLKMPVQEMRIKNILPGNLD